MKKATKQKKKRFALVTSIVSMLAAGVIALQSCICKTGFFSSNAYRNIEAEELSGRKWAEKIELAGVPNFYRVSEGLYRSGQPTKEGFEQLRKFGIKTVINLRSFHSDRNEIGELDFNYERMYVKPWFPKDKEVKRFLETVTGESKQPVLVHCQHGADRTGLMIAIYRIAIEGWSKEEAIEEMTKGGFGFHYVYDNLKDYIREFDIKEVMESAGLQAVNN